MKKIVKIISDVFLVISLLFLGFSYLYATKNPILDPYKEYFFWEDSLKTTTKSYISGSNVSIDIATHPYYTMLTRTEKTIYKQVVANVEAFETQFAPEETITSYSLERVMRAFFDDNPEYFYVDTNYQYSMYEEEDEVAFINMMYNDLKDNYTENKEKIDQVVDSIVEGANTYEFDYQKELYVYNTLIELIDYDEKSDYNQSIYSALVNHKTVCAGYAKSFQYIMNLLEINTYYIEGISEGEHAWNLIKIDGEYYNVDLTWDDSLEGIYYLNATDETLKGNHERKELSIYLPSATATTYQGDKLDFKDSNYEILKEKGLV